jgi:hypothetical protein
MNDRDPFHAGDPLDRTLTQAFGSRHVPTMSGPSLIDVRHRARRRQQRRTAGLVGAITLVGAGGVGAYAIRHDDGRAALSPGDFEGVGGPSTTVACFAISTTVPVQPTVSTVLENVEPTVLPTTNAVTVSTVTFMPLVSTTVVSPAFDPCAPGGWTWHCTGELGTDEFGRHIFESCEQVEPAPTNVGEPVPTTSPVQPVGTTTTMAFYECPPNASCVAPGYTVPPTTPNSVDGKIDATSTTDVVYESTTTSLG